MLDANNSPDRATSEQIALHNKLLKEAIKRTMKNIKHPGILL